MDLEQIFAAAKVTSTQSEHGTEIRKAGKLVMTIAAISDNDSRITYPPGGEYTHTSMWGTPFSEKLVRKYMLDQVIGQLMEVRGSLCQ